MAMRRPKEPFVPPERSHTIRREIIGHLHNESLSARELSSLVGIPEKEVALHLEHVRKSLGVSDRGLTVSPARCRTCGFLFRKRDRLTTPGRCPVCHGESIEEPRFSIA